MSWLCDSTELVPGAWLSSRYAGHGVLAENIPSAGGNGPSALYGCVSLPADAGKEVCGYVTRWPAAALDLAEDGTFLYAGPADYFEFRLRTDGVLSTTDIGFGPGISRITLAGPGSFVAAVTLDDSTVGSSFASGAASSYSGAVSLADTVAAGSFWSGAASVNTLATRRAIIPAAVRRALIE